MLKVFIIILNFNGWPDTLECLASLSKVNYDNFEVILIDNGSKEPMPSLSVIPAKAGIQDFGSRVKPGMTEESGEFSNLKITQIFNKDNIGFAGGNNQGIKMALERGADYVLLLNNDITVEPDFLTELIKAAEQNKKGGILGPMTYIYDSRLDEQKTICSAGGRIIKHFTCGTLIGYKEIDKGQYNKLKEVDYISGACLLIKCEVIEKIGLISEDYFLYYEDGDWCLRARQAGYQCFFVPPSVIYHKASKSAQEFSYPYIYYHSRNGLIFASRFGSRFLIYLISAWIFLKQVIKLVIGYKRDWARPVMKGVMDFWKGKKGKLEGFY